MVFSGEIPEHLVEHRVEVHLLRGQQGKSRAEVHGVVLGETGDRVDAGAVLLAHAVSQHTVDEIEVFTHRGIGIERFVVKLPKTAPKCKVTTGWVSESS